MSLPCEAFSWASLALVWVERFPYISARRKSRRLRGLLRSFLASASGKLNWAEFANMIASRTQLPADKMCTLRRRWLCRPGSFVFECMQLCFEYSISSLERSWFHRFRISKTSLNRLLFAGWKFGWVTLHLILTCKTDLQGVQSWSLPHFSSCTKAGFATIEQWNLWVAVVCHASLLKHLTLLLPPVKERNSRWLQMMLSVSILTPPCWLVLHHN